MKLLEPNFLEYLSGWDKRGNCSSLKDRTLPLKMSRPVNRNVDRGTCSSLQHLLEMEPYHPPQTCGCALQGAALHWHYNTWNLSSRHHRPLGT